MSLFGGNLYKENKKLIRLFITRKSTEIDMQERKFVKYFGTADSLTQALTFVLNKADELDGDINFEGTFVESVGRSDVESDILEQKVEVEVSGDQK